MASKSLKLWSSARELLRQKNFVNPIAAPCGSLWSHYGSSSATPWDLQNVRPRSKLSLGQPTLESHAEYFRNPGEIMPGIFKEEFRSRRETVCHIISELVGKTTIRGSDVNHLIVIPAAPKRMMTENIPYAYRQNSNFLYLSGSYDPEAFIVMCVTPTEQVHALFLTDPDPTSELWDGPKTSPKAAVEHYGFDEAFTASEFDKFINAFAQRTNRKVKVWCEDRSIAERYLDPSFGFEFKNAESPKAIVDTLRLIKSPAEVDLMRQSANIASEAFQQTIKFCAELCSKGVPLSEAQIWAKLDYECRMNGAERLAYPPVVASGNRANIIHYVFNSNKCHPNDMVLVDAGCEFFGYCSDITRTWPVSGRFHDERHKVLYEMLHSIQTKLITKVQPGISLDKLFRVMSDYLIDGLQDIGILAKDRFNKWGSDGCHDLALRFCPHHVSHYLGMDVHDTPTVDRTEPLQPGMVVTVEPGLYLSGSSKQKDLLTKVGREFIGIAIRIEDDILVTREGQSVLTAACPKSIEDIEKWGTVKRA